MREATSNLVVVAMLVLAVVAGLFVLGEDPEAERIPEPVRDVTSYFGLGAWIDVFDYAPAFQAAGRPPPVGPEVVDRLEDHGVDTLYLQVTHHDVRATDGMADADLAGELLQRAQAAGMRVVGWYLPTFEDVVTDVGRLRLIHEFSHEGHRFDGVAVDIEYIDAVADAEERSRRLLDLSRRVRLLVGDDALGAIVPPPVLLEVINPENWPDFPWRGLGGIYDVWLPMSYWTFRTEESGYRDGRRYTEESVTRLRDNLGDPDALVHPIGGIADELVEDDYRAFAAAAESIDAIGLSVYDVLTTEEEGWEVLSEVAPRRP